ncbi:MAG: 1-deoxy-D-xylulose-5-phosphate reductoisomerase, partial [Gammaproteobacteria bacterium]
GLSANTDVERLAALCREHHPDYAVMADELAAQRLRERLRKIDSHIEVLAGIQGLETIAAHPRVACVMAAIVGAAGLMPALAAVRAGKRILLANKEALVMSGQIFMDEVRLHNAELLPVDSEHNAILQCLPTMSGRGLEELGVSRILLTASGGPFRTTPLDELREVTPAQACAHPNWEMGRKISVDSATMMNKGLEVIEARWLFATSPERIQVVIHPQSVIHSMVEYVDGSILAQMGSPDMRTPIACALAWPERIASGVERLDLFDVAQLNFSAPDTRRFPCLRLAYDALASGGTATTVLSAANEVAVQAFLDGELAFTAIAEIVEATLNEIPSKTASSLNLILEEDAHARGWARELIAHKAA